MLGILNTAAGVAVLVAIGHAQRPIVRPELLSGEWETTTPTGVHGILLHITSYQGGAGPGLIGTQSIHIRVYHRQNGQETWGWWGDNGSVSSAFDGVRLRAEKLDVSFDSDMHRWTGTWLLDGESRTVLLERPGCQSHRACGTWEGRRLSGGDRIHFVQSADGVLTAWLDAALGSPSQSHGDYLTIVSSDPSNVVVETVSGICCPSRFSGRLSDDGSTWSGEWSSLKSNVDTYQVLRRLP
jgi:hypothetical protein